MSELTEKARALYRRCDNFPEGDPAGMAALLDLRNIVPDLLNYIGAYPLASCIREYASMTDLSSRSQSIGGVSPSLWTGSGR